MGLGFKGLRFGVSWLGFGVLGCLEVVPGSLVAEVRKERDRVIEHKFAENMANHVLLACPNIYTLQFPLFFSITTPNRTANITPMGPLKMRVGAASEAAGIPESINTRAMLGLSWGYIGVILGLYWGSIGVILGLYWGYLGVILGLSACKA